MTWLALDELDQVMALSQFWSLERFNLVSFYRNDYLGGNTGEDIVTLLKLPDRSVSINVSKFSK